MGAVTRTKRILETAEQVADALDRRRRKGWPLFRAVRDWWRERRRRRRERRGR
jgi:hypothetical protein